MGRELLIAAVLALFIHSGAMCMGTARNAGSAYCEPETVACRSGRIEVCSPELDWMLVLDCDTPPPEPPGMCCEADGRPYCAETCR